LHLQSLAPIPVSRRVYVRQAAGRKIIAESLSQYDEKYVVPTPLSGIRVGGRNTAGMTNSIAIRSQSVLGVRAVNPLIAFYDIQGIKGKVIFFFLSLTPH
jgi:hypothetical protein